MVKECKSDSWFLKDDVSITENEALNADLKDIGIPYLSSVFDSWKSAGCVSNQIEKLNSHITPSHVGCILQIQRVRNVSCPKTNEESKFVPRLLKITLTDGHTNCSMLDLHSSSIFSLKTSLPGTKVLLNLSFRNRDDCIKVRNGILILQHHSQVEVIGGKVDSLIAKWKLSSQSGDAMFERSLQLLSNSGDGPPMWTEISPKLQSQPMNSEVKSSVDLSEQFSRMSVDSASHNGHNGERNRSSNTRLPSRGHHHHRGSRGRGGRVRGNRGRGPRR